MGYKVDSVASHATCLYQLFNPNLNLFHNSIFAAKIRNNSQFSVLNSQFFCNFVQKLYEHDKTGTPFL